MPDFSRWLIVSDFDRTLTDRQSRIPAANLEAIRYFTAHGGLFTMGTGRSVPMFRPYQAGIPCNAPLILFNGAALYDYGTDELTETVWIPEGRALLRALLDRYPELWFEIQHRDAHYLIGENPRRDRFYRDLGVEYRVVGPEEVPVPFLKLAIFSEFRDLGVSQFFGGTPAERARFDEAERQINRDWPELVADRSAPLILDVQHRRATKGAAARRLAERLGITFYDGQIDELAAEQSGLPLEKVREMSRHRERAAFSDLRSAVYEMSNDALSPEDLLYVAQASAIRQIAAGGESCVILGRCADYVLYDDPNCFRIFVHARPDIRVKRTMAMFGLSQEEAVREMENTDRARGQYYKRYTGREYGAQKYYHLGLDSGLLGTEESVESIIGILRRWCDVRGTHPLYMR